VGHLLHDDAVKCILSWRFFNKVIYVQREKPTHEFLRI